MRPFIAVFLLSWLVGALPTGAAPISDPLLAPGAPAWVRPRSRSAIEIEAFIRGEADGGRSQLLRLEGLRIEGPLDLSNCQLDFGLVFENCVFGDAISLQDNRSPGVEFEHCTLARLNAHRVIVANNLALRHCRVSGAANLSAASVGGQLSLWRSTFEGKDAPVSLDDIHVAGMLFLRGCEFAGPISLNWARLDRNMDANDARFLNSSVGADLDAITAAGALFFRGCVFAAPPTIVGTSTGDDLDLSQVTIWHSDSPVDCRVRTGGHFLLRHSRVYAPFKLTDSTIAGSLASAQLVAGTEAAPVALDLSGTQIAHRAVFNASRIYGTLTLSHTRITEYLGLDSASITSDRDALECGSLAIEGSLYCRRANIRGAVQGAGLRVGGDIEFEGTRVLGFLSKVELAGMKVEGDVSIEGATFASEVDAHDCHVGGSILACGVRFLCSTVPVDLAGGQVGHDVRVCESDSAHGGSAVLAGGLEAYGLQADRVRLTGAVGLAAGFGQVPRLDLSAAHITRELGIADMELNDLVLASTTVDGSVVLSAGSARRWADLRGASWRFATLAGWRWPPVAGTNLLSLRVEHFDLTSLQEWATLWAERGGDRENASEFVKFVDARGRDDIGTTVVNALADHERRAGSLGKQIWLLAAKATVGYGRHPSRAFICLALAAAPGLLVFQRRRMSHSGPAPDFYSNILYTVSLALPVVNLQLPDKWGIAPEHCVANWYARFLILLGWLLVPIGLLGMTGFFK